MTMKQHSMQDAIKLNSQRQLCDNCRASVKATGKNAPQVRLSDDRFNNKLRKNYQLWESERLSEGDCCVVLFSWEQVLEAKVRCILCSSIFQKAAESRFYAKYDRSTCILAVKYKNEKYTKGIHSMWFHTNHTSHHLLLVTICPLEWPSSEGNAAFPTLGFR